MYTHTHTLTRGPVYTGRVNNTRYVTLRQTGF